MRYFYIICILIKRALGHATHCLIVDYPPINKKKKGKVMVVNLETEFMAHNFGTTLCVLHHNTD